MDILYLAVANVSIWALIFHGEQLLFWCLLVGRLPQQGNRQGQTLPWQAPSLWRVQKGPTVLGGLRVGGCWQGTGFPVAWSVFEQHWECLGNQSSSSGARQLIKLAE